jgi:hypothetical protein
VNGAAFANRRYVGVGLGVAIGCLLFVGGYRVATEGGSGPRAVSLPSTTPSTTPSTPPSDAPSEQVSAQPTPTLTRAPSATSTPTPTSTPASPRTYAWPTPTRSYAPLAVRVTLAPGGGTTQTPFTLRVHLTDGDGDVGVDRIRWGDGSIYRTPPGPQALCAYYPSPTAPPGPYRPHPSDATWVFGHAWRHAGTYQVLVETSSSAGRCQAGYHEAPESVAVHVDLTIEDDPVVTGNGPAQPTIEDFTVNRDTSSPRDVYVGWDPNDTDGWATASDITWGDGSTEGSYDRGTKDCVDGAGAFYPGDQPSHRGVVPTVHTYAHSGTYTITVTVTSAGCDGQDLQQVTRTRQVRVP